MPAIRSAAEIPPLQTGDVVITGGDPRSVVSRAVMWATRSRYTHCFLMINEVEAIEADLTHGVRVIDGEARIHEVLAGGREVHVLEVSGAFSRGLSGYAADKIYATARRMVGRRYDVLQALCYGTFRTFVGDGPRRVTCGHLMTAIYRDALGVPLFRPEPKNASYPRLGQLIRGWATPGELLQYSILTPVVNRVEVLPPPRDARYGRRGTDSGRIPSGINFSNPPRTAVGAVLVTEDEDSGDEGDATLWVTAETPISYLSVGDAFASGPEYVTQDGVTAPADYLTAADRDYLDGDRAFATDPLPELGGGGGFEGGGMSDSIPDAPSYDAPSYDAPSYDSGSCDSGSSFSPSD